MNPSFYEPTNPDTGSVNAAIATAYVAGGGKVECPPAIYDTSPGPIIMKPNVWLSGTRGATIFRLMSQLDLPLIQADDSTLVKITDLSLDMGDFYGGANSCAVGLGPGRSAVIRDIEILNMGRFGITGHRLDSFDIADNYIARAAPLNTANNGILIIDNGSSTGKVRCNRVVNTGTALNVLRSLVDGNEITGAGYGAGIVFPATPTCGYNRASNNLCADSFGLDSDGFFPKGIENWGGVSDFFNNSTLYNSGTGFCQGGQSCTITGFRAMGNGKNEQPGVGLLIASSGSGTLIDGAQTWNINGRQGKPYGVQPGATGVVFGTNIWN